jgi:hypothetical protein
MMLTVLGGLIGTFLAWCVFQFIGRPLVKFRDLRTDISARLAEYDNVMAQWKETEAGLQKFDIPATEQTRLEDAKSAFRKLGSEMKALAENERLVVRLLKTFRYDPASASAGLIGLSNSIATYGVFRHKSKKMIQRALRFTEG